MPIYVRATKRAPFAIRAHDAELQADGSVTYHRGDPEVRHRAAPEDWRRRSKRVRGESSEKNARFRRALAKRYGRKCCKCRRALPMDALTLDHIVPLVCGGKHVLENLQLLCSPCNGEKGRQTADYRGWKRKARR